MTARGILILVAGLIALPGGPSARERVLTGACGARPSRPIAEVYPASGMEVAAGWDRRIKDCTALLASRRLGKPERALAYNSRAEGWRAQHALARAILDSSRAIRLNPRLAAAYNNRGAAWMELRDHDTANRSRDAWRVPRDYRRAMSDLNAAIRLDPRLAGAYVNRGLLWWEQDFVHNIRDYSAAIRIDPKLSVARFLRGRLYRFRHQGDEDLGRAIADWTEAIRLTPKHWSAYDERARALRARRQYDLAIADWTRLIDVGWGRAGIEAGSQVAFWRLYLERAAVWRDKGEPDRAIEDYDAMISGCDCGRDKDLAYLGRAAVRLDNNDDDRAIADLSDAIALNPRLVEAYRSRSMAWLRKGEIDRADRDALEARRLGAKP